MEVENVLQVRVYDLSDEEKVSIIRHWLGREGLKFIQTLPSTEKKCMQNCDKTIQCTRRIFRLQHNEMILSLQYCKLHRKEKESAQNCMSWLHIKAAESDYKEHGRRHKEQLKLIALKYIVS